MSAVKRLKKELIRGYDDPAVSAAPLDEDNFMQWDGFIEGPEYTPWEGGFFHVRFKFPDSYPMKPPKVIFLNRVPHPNVSSNSGEICLDILKSEWKPVLGVNAVLTSLRSLLADPNPKSPLNVALAKVYVSDRMAYDAEVRRAVVESWAYFEEWSKGSTNLDEEMEEEVEAFGGDVLTDEQ